jgi:hypothetical protein
MYSRSSAMLSGMLKLACLADAEGVGVGISVPTDVPYSQNAFHALV